MRSDRAAREMAVASEPESSPHLPFRLAFVLITAILIAMIVFLPLAFSSVMDEIFNPAEGDIYALPIAPGVPPAATSARLHVAAVDLDEAKLLLSLRVSGHLACAQECGFAD